MPPHRIVQEARFKKIFTRSDFLVCVTPLLTRLCTIFGFDSVLAPPFSYPPPLPPPPPSPLYLTLPSFSSSSCYPPPPPLLPPFACSYIERAKFQDAQFKEVTVKVAASSRPCAAPLTQLLQDVDDTAGPLFANAKDYALVSVSRPFLRACSGKLYSVKQRVLEEQLSALTAKDEDGEMT